MNDINKINKMIKNVRLPEKLEKVFNVDFISNLEKFEDIANLYFENITFCDINITFYFENIYFLKCKFFNIDFSRCNYNNIKFQNCIFENCTFENTIFNQVLIDNCNLKNNNFEGASFNNFIVSNSVIKYNNFILSKFNYAKIIFSNMDYSFLSEVTFKNFLTYDTSWAKVEFFKTKLDKIDVSKCNIEGIIISNNFEELKGMIVSYDQAVSLSKLLGIVLKED